MEKQLFHGKVVRASELDDCYIRDGKLIKHRLELPVLVLPEDDPSLIELRQRGGKTFYEIKLYAFFGHFSFSLIANDSHYDKSLQREMTV